MPDNQPILDAERAREEWRKTLPANMQLPVSTSYPETTKEHRYREALERIRDGVFFLHYTEVQKIVDEALKTG